MQCTESCLSDVDKSVIWSVGFSPDGKRVISGDDGVIKIWDTVTGSELIALHSRPGRELTKLVLLQWQPHSYLSPFPL